ncbi:MAG: manganese efflux pump [bacterium]|nr:manganese efflux pump [bacterium]
MLSLDSPFSILLLALALGCDAFSVSLGIGSGERFKGQSFRLGWHFGLFQSLLTLAGWSAGRVSLQWLSYWDHWFVFLVLSGVALHAFYEALYPDKRDARRDLSRGWFLVSLSLAVSIDALAVGVVLAVAEISPWRPALTIGAAAGLMALVGLHLGRRLREAYGRAMEFAGGALLMYVAFEALLKA